jgi:hypothetical protein
MVSLFFSTADLFAGEFLTGIGVVSNANGIAGVQIVQTNKRSVNLNCGQKPTPKGTNDGVQWMTCPLQTSAVGVSGRFLVSEKPKIRDCAQDDRKSCVSKGCKWVPNNSDEPICRYSRFDTRNKDPAAAVASALASMALQCAPADTTSLSKWVGVYSYDFANILNGVNRATAIYLRPGPVAGNGEVDGVTTRTIWTQMLLEKPLFGDGDVKTFDKSAGVFSAATQNYVKDSFVSKLLPLPK